MDIGQWGFLFGVLKNSTVSLVTYKREKMKKYSFLIVIVVGLLMLSSCSQELAVTSLDGRGTPVRFSVTAGQMKNVNGTIATRSADLTKISESEITNLWVLQFASDGSFLKSVYIPAASLAAVDVTLAPGTGTHVYFLANWGLSLLSSFSGTETAFSTLTRTLTGEGDLLFSGSTVSGKSDLPMISAKQTVTVPTAGYVDMSANVITMNYAVARITLSYKVTASNFVLRRIRVCNIPITHELCPPVVAKTTPTYPATLTSTTVFNTDYTTVSSNTGSITYYVPENQRGQTSSNTVESQKSGIAGDYPTYIELVGYTTINDGRGEIHYRIYPGGDAVTDYNIVRGIQYGVEGNLTGISSIDSRVSEQTLANSYVLAPGQTVYIPVKRANQSDLGIQFTDVTSSSLTPFSVWQSASGLVTSTMDNVSGCIAVTAPSATATGNAVVAVKSGSTVVWSWHIWVTGYDPSVMNLTQNNMVWMDRNLGALAACTGSNTVDQTGGLFYQWGRKDPFPGVTSGLGETSTYYNGSTTATTGLYATANANTTGTTAPNYNLALAIKNPSTFYYGASGNNYDWYTPGSSGQNNYLWIMGSGKTVYDPCPAGWRVPLSGAWILSGWNAPSGTSNTNYGKWTYSGVTSYYPASGWRDKANGGLGGVGNGGNYGSASTSGTSQIYLVPQNGSVVQGNIGRALGISVRCVKE